MPNTLIVYYTYSKDSVTKKAAEAFQAATGGDIFELVTATAYPDSHEELVEQAKREIDVGYEPKLVALPNVSGYDVIIAGAPNWCGTYAPPLATFFGQSELAGKTVIPFICYAGSGVGSAATDARKLAKGAAVTEAIGFKASEIDRASEIIAEAMAKLS